MSDTSVVDNSTGKEKSRYAHFFAYLLHIFL